MAKSPALRLSAPALLALAVVFVVTGAWAERSASAREWNFGVGLAVGGTGIQKEVLLNEAAVPVSRSEGPAVLLLSVSTPFSSGGNDELWAQLEHTRGFRLGPASSGVSFTGGAVRWYFRGASTLLPSEEPEHTQLILKRFVPYVAGSFGVATGTITRELDQVTSVDGSGVYFGFKLGADYPLFRGLGLRPELAMASTFFGPTNLSLLTIGVTAVFIP
jgi:hypothetical protein